MSEESELYPLQVGFPCGIVLVFLLAAAADQTSLFGWWPWQGAVLVVGTIMLLAIVPPIWRRRCQIFGHSWRGCVCGSCGQHRDECHDWNICYCRGCNKLSDRYQD